MGRIAKIGDDYFLPHAAVFNQFESLFDFSAGVVANLDNRKRVHVTPDNIDHIQRYFDSGDFVYIPCRNTL